MNWDKTISQNERRKVERLIRNFEMCLFELHGQGDAADQDIIQQWRIFKVLIEKNPNEPHKLYKYLSKISSSSRKEFNAEKEVKIEASTKLKAMSKTSEGQGKLKASERQLLLKMEMKSKATQLVHLVELNNRMLLEN